jgi:hypothetical protein
MVAHAGAVSTHPHRLRLVQDVRLLPRKEGEARIVVNSSVGIDSTNQRPG